MQQGQPSRTAWSVAWRRAEHQRLESPPRVLEDPLALRIIGPEIAARLSAADRARGGGRDRRDRRALRAFVVARSRFAEDTLAEAVARGVRQYVVLGAGFDTSAYRHPHGAAGLRIFEVDHPATQAVKRHRLREAGIPFPPELTFVPVDFEREQLPARLAESGFDATAPVFVSWLGVTMYLTREAWSGTLRFLADRPRGSGVVFDYSVSPSALGWHGKFIHWVVRRRVARIGEPWLTNFRPEQLRRELRDAGFATIDDLGSAELNARYFHGRPDGFKLVGYGRIARAMV